MNPRGSWLTQAHTIHRAVQVDLRHIALLTFLIGTAFAALLVVPVTMYHHAEARNVLKLRHAEQERVIKLATQIIHQEMDSVLSDLRYLSQHNALRSYLANDNREQRRGLALEYLGLSRQKRIYDQIRFIGLDGKEEVRVDFAGGSPRIRPDHDLQNKHERYYSQETQWLSPGQIYVSPFDLNIERNAIDLPIKPVIRFAVPVADTQGLIRGSVVLNYLGRRLLDKLAVLSGQAGDLWLLNAEGYWLMGSDRENEWAFMFPDKSRRNAAALATAFWRQATAQQSGTYHDRDSWIRFERIHPLRGGGTSPAASDFAQPVASDYHWTLAVVLSRAATGTADPTLPRRPWTIYATLALLAYLAAGALAFALNRNKALAESLEKVIDSLPTLIAYVDAEQRYRFNNKAYEGFFGLSPRKIYGRTLREMLGEEAYREVSAYVAQVLTGKQVAFERQLAYAGAGMRDVMVAFLPDSGPKGEVRGFFMVANDVSLIKESERRERQRMLELAHVSRLASMGEMATEIAHEINQPLAAIAMFSAAGLRTLNDAGDSAQVAGWLETINAQAKRASEIVRRIRQFVRKNEPQRGPVNLNRVADEVAALLRYEAQSQQIEMVLRLDPELPLVQAELILLEQVVFNLMRNAMDAVASQSGSRRIALVTAHDAQQVYLEVRDNGPGIDPALGERIFDSFMTNKKEGLGMGLTISRSIVEAHAGKLWFALDPEGGTVFAFSLPRETSC